MRDEAFRVPCFRWIDVQVEGQSQPYRFKDEELAKSYDPGSGVFSSSLALPAGSAARIVSNRYEKVFVPGMYTLLMPELITHPDGAKSDSRTVHITVENLRRTWRLTGKTISVSKESATSASIEKPTTRVSAQNEPSTTAPPKPATHWSSLTQVQGALPREMDAAVRILTQVIDNLPKEYLPYKELTRIYSYQHKTEQAIEYYQKAIGLMKSSDGWLRDAFQCRIFRLRSHFAESIACIQNLKIPSSGDPAQMPYELGSLMLPVRIKMRHERNMNA